jgi:hypothetical protein
MINGYLLSIHGYDQCLQYNQVVFHHLIDNLKDGDLNVIKNQTNIRVLIQAFDFFDKNEINLSLLIAKIKIAFNEKKCLCTNNDKNKITGLMFN